MYDQGADLPKDDTLAVHWYRQAAEQGYTDAQLSLAMMLANEQSVKADSSEAYQWFQRAAEAGNASAQFNLGTYMAHGIGMAKDLPSAAYWLSLAANQGHEGAIANRDYVLKMLNDSEHAEVERRLKTAPNGTLAQDKQVAIQ